MAAKPVAVRQSVQHLQDEYDQGNKKPLDDLVRAWKRIQELPPRDVNCFFVLGGYHGEPFASRPDVDALPSTDTYEYWGGFCNHGNVLFPSWHRVYVWRLEQALQTVVPGVIMPFWDETDAYSLANGIPSVLTQERFELDGQAIRNPLRSYILPQHVEDDFWQDNVAGERNPYFKPPGYETVRYPLSGLVGNTVDREATRAHNDQYPHPRLAQRRRSDADRPGSQERQRVHEVPGLSSRAELHGVFEHHVGGGLDERARCARRAPGRAAQRHPPRRRRL